MIESILEIISNDTVGIKEKSKLAKLYFRKVEISYSTFKSNVMELSKERIRCSKKIRIGYEVLTQAWFKAMNQSWNDILGFAKCTISALQSGIAKGS
ncbi:MAG: hypothetical protein IPK55_10690 [Streptococcus sp.]|nr:hypothetical protein [Streptococcus sp.]